MNIDLKKVHSIQLEMAIEVKRICEKYEIEYFMVAGTLLGAVRHKGFIPWDDDLDIGMLRKDYEKFVNVCAEELNDNLFLQTWNTDKMFALPIAKIRKKGTLFVEKNSSSADIHSGIYIDIFPFDNVPSSKISRYFQKHTSYVLKRLILLKMGYNFWDENSLVKKSVFLMLTQISKFLSADQMKSKLFKIMTRYNNSQTIKIVAFGGAYGYEKESIYREWISSLQLLKFEDEMLAAPRNSKEYLTYFYGDYLKFPPEEKRYNRHNIIMVKFEE